MDGLYGMKNDKLALIVARPSRVRDSLGALLTAITHINTVEQADHALSAIKLAMEHRLDLVLVDSSLPDEEIHTVLTQIKLRQPDTQCIVLADDLHRRQIARSAGADKAVVMGLAAATLLKTIKEMLPQ